MTSADLTLLHAPNLRVPHAFSTRAGGSSAGAYAGLNLDDRGDDPQAVAHNRERLARALGFRAEQFARLTQVHGTDVTEVSAPGHWTGDALVTAAPGVLLAIGTADCFPLLLADPVAEVVGAAQIVAVADQPVDAGSLDIADRGTEFVVDDLDELRHAGHLIGDARDGVAELGVEEQGDGFGMLEDVAQLGSGETRVESDEHAARERRDNADEGDAAAQGPRVPRPRPPHGLPHPPRTQCRQARPASRAKARGRARRGRRWGRERERGCWRGRCGRGGGCG